MESEKIVAEIRKAFLNVTLNGGLTIHQADLEGAFTDPGVKLEARKKDLESFWWEIPDWKIEKYHSAISFLDRNGFRFYMPAVMTWVLRNGKKTTSITAYCFINSLLPGYCPVINPVLILTKIQASTVYSFLKFVETYYSHSNAKNALISYWDKFCH